MSTKTILAWVNGDVQEIEVEDVEHIVEQPSIEGRIAVLENDVLTLLQNERFLQINLSDGCIINEKPFEILGGVFEIRKIEKDYMVYGEIEIARFDKLFNKLWSFSGKDIFVSNSNKKAFEISDNRIKLYDFEGNYYEIDFDGKVLVS